MRRSSLSVTLVLIGTAALMQGCDVSGRGSGSGSSSETTGTASNRYHNRTAVWYRPWAWGSRSSPEMSTHQSAVSGDSGSVHSSASSGGTATHSTSSSRGGFGSSGHFSASS
ncbi:MAG: hypothetical protein K1X53_14585 [Candidatus Sumerlaeaceae bacterium]|nr:hypothetical protein [Candidatus Sumerlaeaceae bacterium]